MNSARTTIRFIVLLSIMTAGLAHTGVGFAAGDAPGPGGVGQSRGDSIAQTGPTVQPPSKNPKAAAPRAAAGKEVFGPRFEYRISNINKLRAMMEEKIELTPEQKAKINGLFNDFIEDMRNNSPQRSRDPNTPANKVYPPSMRDLEKQLKSAEEKGDDAATEKIRREITILKKEPSTATEDYSPVLIEKVAAELKPEQAATFASVVERWKAVSPRGPRTGPFKQLRRALLDPEVGLTEAERATVEKVLNDALKSGRAGGDRNAEKMAEAVEKARAVIFEKLTPEKREKVEANLKAFKAEERNLDDSKSRGPRRVGMPKQDKKAGGLKEESEDKAAPEQKDKDDK